MISNFKYCLLFMFLKKVVEIEGANPQISLAPFLWQSTKKKLYYLLTHHKF